MNIILAGMDVHYGLNDNWPVLLWYYGFGLIVGYFNARVLYKQWRESDHKTNVVIPHPFWNKVYESTYIGLGVLLTALLWPIVIIEPIVNYFRKEH